MKALRFYGSKDLRVEDIADPKMCGPRQVIVKVAWCGICGTDLHEYTTGPIFMPRQQILGHEFSGTVVEVGSELKDYREGDRVAIQPLLTPGDDYYSVRGLGHLSEPSAFVGIRDWAWGGMGEYAVLNDYNVFKLPDSVSDEQGALVEPAAVTLYAVDNSGLQPGNTVLISGAGTIGALTVLSVNAAGASQIFVAEPNPARRKFIESWGLCAGVFDPITEDVPGRIREQTTVGVDVAIECAGNENSLAVCLRSVRRQGTVVQVGLPTATCNVDLQLLVIKDATLRGSFCYPIYSWPRVIGLIAAGKLPVEKTISSLVSLDAAVPDGFEVLIAPGTDRLKILIQPAA
jgi:(R,R)-butanediol dehydrogenase/meso-butanediol dehydrogenase/diacetyl reductase